MPVKPTGIPKLAPRAGASRGGARHAYVTMMVGGDAYVPGLEALGRSLAETGTAVPRVAMVTGDVDGKARARLTAQGWILREIEPIANPLEEGALLYARFAATFTKLRAFDLAEFDKIVFVDADTVVLRNVDELFERPAIAAAPDFFMPDRFNSGVMVIEPSHELFGRLHASLLASPTYDGGDQGVLNAYWPDWWSMPVEHRLETRYNIHHFVFQFLTAHPSLRRRFLDEIRIVHYTLQKPWKGFTITGGAEVWWEKYYGAHPEKKRQRLLRRLHALEDWSFDSVVRALGGT
jgi:alpha-N-acetylglucosamine transferase